MTVVDRLQEDVLAKTAKDLYQEILRYYPVAAPEDYLTKTGRWNNELMRLDLQLLKAHRHEAGAPDLISLNEVELPANLPTDSVPELPGMGRPVPELPGMGMKALASSIAVAAPPQYKALADFIIKHKLDPTRRTKLGCMAQEKQKYVIEKFSPLADHEPGTKEALDAFDKFIEECEKTNWKEAGLTEGTAAAGTSPAKPKPAVPPSLLAPSALAQSQATKPAEAASISQLLGAKAATPQSKASSLPGQAATQPVTMESKAGQMAPKRPATGVPSLLNLPKQARFSIPASQPAWGQMWRPGKGKW